MKIKRPSVGDDEVIDVVPHLKVRVEKLSESMEQQAGLYAYYASLADAATQDEKDVLYRIYTLQEALDGKLRAKYEAAGQKFTESSLKAAINRDPEIMKLFARHRRRARDAGQLRVFVEALKQKKDMLQMLGAMTRGEREQEVRTFVSKWKAKAKPHHGRKEENGDE